MNSFICWISYGWVLGVNGVATALRRILDLAEMIFEALSDLHRRPAYIADFGLHRRFGLQRCVA